MCPPPDDVTRKNRDQRCCAYSSYGTATTKTPGHFDLCKMWTANKDNPDNNLGWVSENFVGTYQASLRDAAGAWKAFFDSRNGKRKGRRVGRPKFKSKHRARKSFQVHGGTLQIVDTKHIKVPKIGILKTHESTRKLYRRTKVGAARLIRGTISQTSSGRWQIALTVEIDREIRTGPSKRQRDGGIVGIDLGVRDRVTCSDGTIWRNPQHLEGAQQKLARLNRRLARAKKGSSRRAKVVAQLGRAHNRVANLRRDHTEKMTSLLIHIHSAIAVEGWDAQQLAEHGSQDVPRKVRRKRNRSLADAAPGMIRWQLEHKSAWYGSNVIVVGRLEPTGKTCSKCGTVKTKPIPPTKDMFHCDQCGHSDDRRINSAKIVAKLATGSDASNGGESQNVRREDVRPKTPRRRGQPSTKRKSGTKKLGKTGTPDP